MLAVFSGELLLNVSLRANAADKVKGDVDMTIELAMEKILHNNDKESSAGLW